MDTEFHTKLKALNDSFDAHSGSDTPDYLLAKFLEDALFNFETIVVLRDHWYNYGRYVGEKGLKHELDKPLLLPELSDTWQELILSTVAGLRSYQYGNSAPNLAEALADQLESTLRGDMPEAIVEASK